MDVVWWCLDVYTRTRKDANKEVGLGLMKKDGKKVGRWVQKWLVGSDGADVRVGLWKLGSGFPIVRP